MGDVSNGNWTNICIYIYRWRSKKPCHEVKLLSLPKLHSSKTVTRVSTTLKNRWFQFPSPVYLSYTLALWRRYFRNSSCPSSFPAICEEPMYILSLFEGVNHCTPIPLETDRWFQRREHPNILPSEKETVAPALHGVFVENSGLLIRGQHPKKSLVPTSLRFFQIHTIFFRLQFFS